MPIPLPPPDFDLTGGPGTPGQPLHNGQLVLGDVVFGATDDYGVEWILTSLNGWVSPAASTGTTEQRANQHGGWVGEAFYAPRIIEIEGVALANSWDDAEAAVDRLFANLPLSTLAPLYVATNTRTLQAMVRQEGEPLSTIVDGVARCSLSLVAPDPRRYGPQEVSTTGLPQTTGGLSLPIVLPITIGAAVASGRTQAVNAGNMASPAVFKINGPCPPCTITQVSTGRRLSVIDAVPAGRFLLLDTDTRSALLDGVAARTVTGSWFELEPGVNDLAFSAASYNPGASLEVIFRSAWR